MWTGKEQTVALFALVAMFASAVQCEQSGAREASMLLEDPQQQQQQRERAFALGTLSSGRHQDQWMAVPRSLARFLFNARQGDRPAQSAALTIPSSAGGYKRSSSALDALTGVTLGKRSANPMELINMEPVFGRQSMTRTPPRVYDMRWAPFDSIETSSPGANNHFRDYYSD